MIIVTNRKLVKGARRKERLFGETFNEKGCNELRLAKAVHKGKRSNNSYLFIVKHD